MIPLIKHLFLIILPNCNLKIRKSITFIKCSHKHNVTIKITECNF